MPTPLPLAPVLSADHPDKPSVYRLPQRCSPDRRRAREATLNLQRSRYAFIEDPSVEDYASAMVQVWYPDDAAVLQDVELVGWARELQVGGQLKGMPAPIPDRRSLASILAEVIYRGSAGHAAVNNGQFDKYGWVPHSPGAARTLNPDPGPDMTEAEFWRCMPPQKRGLAQLSMAWVLSMPTELSLVHAGEMPAFDAELNPAASRVVGVFRRRLKPLSGDIRARNDREAEAGRQPYVYLDPFNVSASIET
jgi:hypothetical protein